MAILTITTDTSDVGEIRDLLAQAGRKAVSIRQDDLLQVFNSGLTGGQSIYFDYGGVFDVAGVYEENDIKKINTIILLIIKLFSINYIKFKYMGLSIFS